MAASASCNRVTRCSFNITTRAGALDGLWVIPGWQRPLTKAGMTCVALSCSSLACLVEQQVGKLSQFAFKGSGTRHPNSSLPWQSISFHGACSRSDTLRRVVWKHRQPMELAHLSGILTAFNAWPLDIRSCVLCPQPQIVEEAWHE